MCWSPEASIGIAVAGVAATVYCYKREESKLLVGVLFYFTLMEILQAYSYSVVNECQHPGNITATYLAYFHVSLQAIAANVIALQFIPVHVKKRIQLPVYLVATLASLAMLARILPLEWIHYCMQIRYRIPYTSLWFMVPFCATEVCTYSGSWHLAWGLPAGHHWMLDNSYFFGVFILPLLYGSWRIAAYIAIVGPGLAIYLSESSNEFAAVWCLMSIGIVFILIATPIRKYMYVSSFYGIPFFKQPTESFCKSK